MILEDVMDEIGERLDTIPGLRVSPYDDDADEVQLPAGLISLPPSVDYSKTFNMMGGATSGMVEQDLLITILVSLVDSRIRRKEIAPYADTTGSKSVKRVLESGTYTAFDTITIYKGNFTILTIADNTYKAFIVTGKIAGS
jgi:hypothetical protein